MRDRAMRRYRSAHNIPLDAPRFPRQSALERWLSYIEIAESLCWLWRGSINSTGYGSFVAGNRKYLAHRFSYEHFIGPIGAGLVIDHLCRVRECVNPDHIEAVSQKVNVHRGIGEAAKNRVKSNCPAGHPYESDNLKVFRGMRYCRACHRRHNLASWRRQREGLSHVTT